MLGQWAPALVETRPRAEASVSSALCVLIRRLELTALTPVLAAIVFNAFALVARPPP
jgi:hypothetical protein